MMQLGNLAIVASKNKECSLQIYGGKVTLYTGVPTKRNSYTCDVKNEKYINKLIAFLNYGTKIDEKESET